MTEETSTVSMGHVEAGAFRRAHSAPQIHLRLLLPCGDCMETQTVLSFFCNCGLQVAKQNVSKIIGATEQYRGILLECSNSREFASHLPVCSLLSQDYYALLGTTQYVIFAANLW